MMRRRMTVTLVVMTGLVATLGFVKVRQVEAAIAQGKAYQPPPDAVTTILAKQELWRPSLTAVGTVAPVEGVTVSADLPGIVDSIEFESGARVAAGQVLVRLEMRQEQAQLKAAQAKRDLAKLSLERMRGLLAQGVSSQAEFDAARADADQTEAAVGEIVATIDRKTIRAPFSGVLGIRQVNRGQYLKAGDPIVPLQALDPIHVDFGVPQGDIARTRVGSEVALTTEGGRPIARRGRIEAIDSVVQESTRNVTIRATVGNADGALRPGMYVTVDLPLDASDAVVALPASAILHAPYGDSVFVVTDLKTPGGKTYKGAKQQFVKLGPSRGDQIAVLSGVTPGQEVVTSGVFKLRNGGALLVDNGVQPGNDPAPRPEDN